MQRILNSLLGLSLLCLTVFATGCGDDGDGGGGGGALSPTIFLASGADLVSADATIPFADGSFFVQVDVNDGDAALNSLTITEDGSTIPAANLSFDGGATTAQNPLLILGADQTGTIYDIEITPTNATPNSSAQYTFTVADVDGLTSSTTVNVTFAAAPPTVTVTADFDDGADRSTTSPTFDLTVDAVAGDADISSVAVYENEVLLPAENVSFVNGATTTAFLTNPELFDIPGASFVGDLRIEAVDPSTGFRTYRVEFTDTNGAIASAVYSVNFVEPMVSVLMGQLLNAAGPDNTGGLDLDTGNGMIGSNNSAAEIKDEGIDLGLPIPQNWKQQISAANNATLRRILPANLPDGFNFDEVISYQEVIDAYEVGSTVAVSARLTGGELFGVLRDGNYYLIRIAQVNVIGTSNGDNYVIDIIKEDN